MFGINESVSGFDASLMLKESSGQENWHFPVSLQHDELHCFVVVNLTRERKKEGGKRVINYNFYDV